MVVWKSSIILGKAYIFPNGNSARKLFTMIAVLSKLGTLGKAISCDHKPASCNFFFLFC